MNNSVKNIVFAFLSAALICLVAGLLFGLIGSVQYILPDFLKETLSFIKTRPLHVTLVVTWIFTAAVGTIIYYLVILEGRKLYSVKLAIIHFVIYFITGLIIILLFLFGFFGGREYLEFPPYVAIPILFTWILFTVNYFGTIKMGIGKWPVYYWMWSTGVVFFLITFLEAHLWTIPFFQHNIVRDMTVQWKAMGSMVGSWNMLVYGTGFYVMEKISGQKDTSSAPLTFFFYFLGLTNLMFNWGHHTYIIPAASWIKNVSYIISMTELLILGNIIYNWRKSLSDTKKNFHKIPFRFLSAADVWIFLNLVLAIVISVPAINFYTHGTHITVAHAMGATIGINTMILFASLFYIISRENLFIATTSIKYGFWITNISLLFFWLSLIGAGLIKSMEKGSGLIFQQVMQKLSPWFHLFTFSGFGVFLGILMISIPLIKYYYTPIFLTEKLLKKQ